MTGNERLITYINSLDAGNSPLLEEIEAEAQRTSVPVIRKETQQLLKVLLAMNCPGRILEVGTAIGFSALLMADCNPVPCRITTIRSEEHTSELQSPS